MDTPLDPILAVSHPNPYPWYRQLRDGPPVTFDASLGLWVAARADVITAALQTPTLRVRPPAEPVPTALVGRPVGELFGLLARMNDGEAAHGRPRAGLQRGLAGIDPAEVTRRATEASGRAPAGWNEWMAAVPVETVAGLLGFAGDDLSAVAQAVSHLVAALSPRATGADRDAGDVAAATLLAQLQTRLTAASPGSLVAGVREAPWRSQRTLLANLAGLLTQTCEATAGLLGNAVVALARGERTEDNDLPAFVDEVLRHDPPVQNTRRHAAEPLSLAGVDLPAGATLLLVLGAAGRDPALNPDAPEQFQVARGHRRTLGFGWGPHACPGATLARTIAVAALAQRRSAGHALPLHWTYRPSVNARLPRFATPGKEST